MTLSPNLKRLTVLVVVVLWAVLLVHALNVTPSKAEAVEKLAEMEKMSEAMLQQGGKVLRNQKNAKFGSALKTIVLSDEGWSDRLLHQYERVLESNGWIKVATRQIAYCKSGMFATITPSSGVQGGVGTNSIAIEYNARTIKQCGAL
jgi:hypothetical protein